jgi:hypothetical protein
MAEKTVHSDLEVVAGGDLEVVQPQYRLNIFPSKHDEATAYSKSQERQLQQDASPVSMQSPAPAYSSIVRSGTVSSQGSSLYNPKAEVSSYHEPERRILGMTRTVFIAFAVGLAVFIIGIIATAVGVVLSQRAAADAAESTAAMPSQSKIAATNWTDTSGVSRTAVIYQEKSGALMLQMHDSISNRWISSNITASIMNTSNTAGLDVKQGTPLATATNGFQVSLYYLTSSNRVAEIYMPGSFLGQWFLGALGSTLNPQAASNSRLTAWWQVCTTCPGSLLVMWEDTSGLIQTANMTGDSDWNLIDPITGTFSAPGTGLALSPFVDYNGVPRTGQDPTALRVYRVVATQMVELMFGPLTRFRAWSLGNFGECF